MLTENYTDTEAKRDIVLLLILYGLVLYFT